MARKPDERSALQSLSPHILPAAGSMIGVCATLIGLIKIVEQSRGESVVDEYIGVTTLLFLLSAFTSYVSLRDATAPALAAWLERAADRCFLVGLVGLTLITVLFAFEVL